MVVDNERPDYIIRAFYNCFNEQLVAVILNLNIHSALSQQLLGLQQIHLIVVRQNLKLILHITAHEAQRRRDIKPPLFAPRYYHVQAGFKNAGIHGDDNPLQLSLRFFLGIGHRIRDAHSLRSPYG